MQFSTAAFLLASSSALALALPAQQYEVNKKDVVVYDVVTVMETYYATGQPTPTPTPEVKQAGYEVVTITQVYGANPTPAPAPKPTPSSVQQEKPKETAPTYVTKPQQGLTKDQQDALDAHNAARADLGYVALTWDSDLAQKAQEWADHLAGNGGALEHGSAGENLYSMWTSWTAEDPYCSAAKAWVSEKAGYTSAGFSEGTGHYTQVVWKDTTKLGMGVAKAGDGTMVVVGRYDPCGNVGGQEYPPTN